ncbi:hypothetical protein GLW04_00995 [Halobacillus litoralis]|uniref:Uncharacterized protein n=1 Tax=Halobacillus litoralis TaxID=45668 RepID=A0A845DYB3_9BACI|nr:hypothetical protein [Halobacillus litoralis]MCA1022510.1 hypothetical protein [Halobacillus litoralis]MYL18444.1 hypothetical protein [Halobacillus litoralis]MYL38565.1 hypothetical protein [Halobacillus litoralis]
MTKRKSSPFDDFWGFSSKDDREDREKESTPRFPDLFEEASKTWKSMSPMIKPFMDKFKK